MTILYLKRVGNALHPVNDEAISEFARLPFNKDLRCEVKQPRNSAHHRLFWSICTRIANGIGSTPENICDVLKIASGHYNLVRSKSYGDIKIPKSIAFSKMTQTEFSKFFDECLNIIFTEWSIDREAFSDLIDIPGSYSGTTTQSVAGE